MILDTIVEQKQREVEQLQQHYQGINYQVMLRQAAPIHSFYQNLKDHGRKKYKFAIVAEVKKASPSKGVIKDDFQPLQIAAEYADSDVAAISVLTDEHFFKGSFSYLQAIREQVKLPLLCKDFIISPYQIVHARLHGADAVLLIAKILETEELKALYQFAVDLGMDCLVEVHDRYDLEKALSMETKVIGINNRNLDTFETHLSNTEKWIKYIPEGIIVISESGIHTAADSQFLEQQGVHGLLVGESLMRSESIAGKIRELRLEGVE